MAEKMVAVIHYPTGEREWGQNRDFAIESVQKGLETGIIALPAEFDARGNRLWDVQFAFHQVEDPVPPEPELESEKVPSA